MLPLASIADLHTAPRASGCRLIRKSLALVAATIGVHVLPAPEKLGVASFTIFCTAHAWLVHILTHSLPAALIGGGGC